MSPGFYFCALTHFELSSLIWRTMETLLSLSQLKLSLGANCLKPH